MELLAKMSEAYMQEKKQKEEYQARVAALENEVAALKKQVSEMRRREQEQQAEDGRKRAAAAAAQQQQEHSAKGMDGDSADVMIRAQMLLNSARKESDRDRDRDNTISRRRLHESREREERSRRQQSPQQHDRRRDERDNRDDGRRRMPSGGGGDDEYGRSSRHEDERRRRRDHDDSNRGGWKRVGSDDRRRERSPPPAQQQQQSRKRDRDSRINLDDWQKPMADQRDSPDPSLMSLKKKMMERERERDYEDEERRRRMRKEEEEEEANGGDQGQAADGRPAQPPPLPSDRPQVAIQWGSGGTKGKTPEPGAGDKAKKAAPVIGKMPGRGKKASSVDRESKPSRFGAQMPAHAFPPPTMAGGGDTSGFTPAMYMQAITATMPSEEPPAEPPAPVKPPKNPTPVQMDITAIMAAAQAHVMKRNEELANQVSTLIIRWAFRLIQNFFSLAYYDRPPGWVRGSRLGNPTAASARGRRQGSRRHDGHQTAQGADPAAASSAQDGDGAHAREARREGRRRGRRRWPSQRRRD